MKKAVIYARYSSERQTEQSIEGQLRVCEKFAEDNGFVIVDMYIDRAMTGRNDHRTDFQRMIKDSAKRTFDFVIVYKLDRFSRNRYDSAINKAVLKKNGVKLLSAVENITDSPEGIILESMLEGMAEYYSAELAQKVRRGQFESLQKKNYLGGNIPYGYIVKDKKFIVCEEQANIVRAVFNDFSKGVMAKDIVNNLKERGIKNIYNRNFCVNSIMNMLRNTKYIGTFKYGTETIDNYMPSIIDKKLFDLVNEKINNNKRTPAKYKAKVNYLLSGKLYCGLCQTLMTGESGTSKSGEIYNYYKCFKKKRNKNACSKTNVKKQWIEDLVINLTLEHIFEPTLYNDIVNRIINTYNEELAKKSVLTSLYKQRTQTQKSIDNLIKAIKQGIISHSTQTELAKLEANLAELEIQIAKQECVAKQKMTKEKVDFWFSQFKDYSPEDERISERIIDSFINKVVLYEDKVIIIYNHTGQNSSNVAISELEQLCSNTNVLAERVVPYSNTIITKDFMALIFYFEISKKYDIMKK